MENDLISRSDYSENVCRCAGPENGCDKPKCTIWQAPAVDAVPTTVFTHVFVKLGRNKVCPIKQLHMDTHQVTVIEKENVYNTVDLDDVVLMTGVPLEHGRWKPIHFEDGILSVENADRCSACGYDRLLGDEHDVRFKTTYNFCPHCGARMDGETK